MKKIVKIIISVTTLFVLSHVVVHANGANDLKERDYFKKYELILKDFQDKTALFEKTGDLHVDFLNQILFYEQMGVELGKAELQFGQNKAIKEVTNEMVKTSKTMIRRIEKILKKMSDDPVVDELKESEYFELYNPTYDSLLLVLRLEKEDGVVKMSGSVEKDFLEKVIPYLEFKIQFANHLLEKGEHEEVRDLAQEIVKVQENKIQQLKALEEELRW